MRDSDLRFFLGLERELHYTILKWNNRECKWEVVHYTPNLEDFERMRKLHPASENCIHLIDYDFVKKHKMDEIMKKIKEMTSVYTNTDEEEFEDD